MEIRGRRKRKKAEVNIVPMVDVLTVLIFFFLLTMQFKEIYAVDITPPEMRTASSVPAAEKPAKVVIDKDGVYFFNDEKVDLKTVEMRFTDIGKSGKNSSVIILSDKETPLHFVTSVIDAAKLAKIKKASLQTKAK